MTEEPVVLAQGKLTNFQIFQIANSNGMTLDSNGQLFSIRFRLIGSFKAEGSNRVVNQYVWEIVTNGMKGVAARKEVERVKVQVIEKEKQSKLVLPKVTLKESSEVTEQSIW